MTNIKSRNLDVHRFVWCVTNWVSRPVPSISSRISYSNLRHPFLLVCVIFNFLIYFVYLCTHHLCVCRLVGVGGFSYHMHPRDQTKVIRLGDRSLSALSHLANSLIFLFFFFKIYSLYFKCDYFAWVGLCLPCGVLEASEVRKGHWPL